MLNEKIFSSQKKPFVPFTIRISATWKDSFALTTAGSTKYGHHLSKKMDITYTYDLFS